MAGLGDYGDVRYHVVMEVCPSRESCTGGWAFGPCLDGPPAFHDGTIPKCP
ncbi:hypothetical protein EDD90_10961 [Streptomyces sp. Ag109_O5-1]|nr:hypothetical protein EDD90_10961 [Streptomyces sp. Ag109_O5-1]